MRAGTCILCKDTGRILDRKGVCITCVDIVIGQGPAVSFKTKLDDGSLQAIREMIRDENIKALKITRKHNNGMHRILMDHITESLKVLDKKLTEVINHEQQKEV